MIKFTLLFLSVLTLVSCREQLYDADALPEEFFETPEQAFEAVDLLYTSGAPAFYGQASTTAGPVAAIGGYLSGYFDNESKSEVPLANFCQQLTFDGNNISGSIDQIWSSAYGAIEKANMLIQHLNRSTKISSDQKRMLLAEAQFFSAFNYFYLVRYFGAVPLLKTGQKWQEATQASIADIYTFVIDELQCAIPNLSDQASRITPFAAQTLLCDIYLTASGYPLQASYYGQAARTAKEIIQNSSFRLTAHDSINGVSAYKMLYNQNSPEVIYGYTPATNTFAALSFSKGAASWGVFSKTTNNAYQPVKAFMSFYDAGVDLRAAEGEFFHSFYKYEKEDRTVIQSFEHAPCIWLDNEALLGRDSVVKRSISIYRFAEVLLIAAEAIAHTEGVTPETIEYLGKVRSRAHQGVKQSEIVAQLTGLDKERFIEEVWRERLREFPLEMKLWNDIQRTRKYPTPIKKGDVHFIAIQGAQNPWGGVYEQRVLLLPISDQIKSQNQTIQ